MPIGETRTIAIFLAAGCWLGAAAQTREAEIEKARDARQAQLAVEAPGKAEQRLIYFKEAKVLERISAGVGGVRVKIGGMPTGSGFALGPEYFRDDLARGELTVNAGAQASTRRWLKFQAGVGAPSFARNLLFWDFTAVHHNYNSMTYYGPGPDSEKSQRTNYRLEDTAFDNLLGVKPHKYVRFGGSAGYLLVNIGPGRDRRYPSTEQVWRDNPRAPGLERHTDFWRWGTFAQLDYRDSPTGPRAGGNYTLRYDIYKDDDVKLHDFRRLDMELQQYVPFFNKRRVIAMRARTVQTFTRPGQTVPFYQQSVLGGGDDLRGFRPYRFHDNNLLLLNAEYRWEVFAGLDMAVFADAGRVSDRRWQFQMNRMESDVGFGLRFNVRNAPFLRLDFAFSHEGFQMFLKFNGVFTQRSWGSSSAPHIGL